MMFDHLARPRTFQHTHTHTDDSKEYAYLPYKVVVLDVATKQLLIRHETYKHL